jgi:protein-S-isoprenylcysteine O-methyltransferase Ste14
MNTHAADSGRDGGLLLRALFAFVAMPGLVAYGFPLLWLHGTQSLAVVRPIALALVLLGTFALLWCVRDFYARGRGTLAPWAPPAALVVVGLYRVTRNPMYVAVLTTLAGWALAFDAPALWVYTLLVAAAFQLRVVLGEEPWLEQQHGAAWREYAARVPRWLSVKRRRC